MGTLPPTLQEKKLRNICLILEGFEEYYYFKRILEFPCFNGTYNVDIAMQKLRATYQVFFKQRMLRIFMRSSLLYVIRTEILSNM